jgi:hypothetical protein
MTTSVTNISLSAIAWISLPHWQSSVRKLVQTLIVCQARAQLRRRHVLRRCCSRCSVSR